MTRTTTPGLLLPQVLMLPRATGERVQHEEGPTQGDQVGPEHLRCQYWRGPSGFGHLPSLSQAGNPISDGVDHLVNGVAAWRQGRPRTTRATRPCTRSGTGSAFSTPSRAAAPTSPATLCWTRLPRNLRQLLASGAVTRAPNFLFPGVDPISNFVDHSDDSLHEHLHAGPGRRLMQAQYALFRK